MGLNVYATSKKKYYKLNPCILTAFFDKKLKYDFNKHDGWHRLENYLAGQSYIQFSGEWTVYLNDDSLLTELSLSGLEEKLSTLKPDEASNSKSLSELGAVGKRSLDIREHTITFKRDETSQGNEEMHDIEAILSDIKNMFKELVSVTVSPSSDESAKLLASNLGPFFERLKSNLERFVSILNLM
ncbi:hypothetical protein NPIL_554591 [Nephila pilipes]|uniref:Uncharacterized protein n=1 Tax=Nephila pilipes TaxID=299642 RepID=A0A8X6QAA3_NEPPI|nr:hypothetical protein NPIL_554591 [Nephila pilipes]